MEAAENRASHDLAVLGQEMSVVKLQQVWFAKALQGRKYRSV
jgi:hypothetical protein